MTWKELCEDPTFADLPYKVETDRFGRILMSPTSNRHGGDQMEIGIRLQALLPTWVVISECGVETDDGTKVPDIAAFPVERCPEWRSLFSMPIAPDICVEVYSTSNDKSEFEEKRRLLAARGCKEFWICSRAGELSFRNAVSGVHLERSRLCPAFPTRLRDGM